mmetsp:Transcript_26589/g.80732  ORF Transcript_26589/g.80732 Transcript_26589/m.80732 type:complete len:188 (-) Transcript_26589:17-580(-)
MAALQGKFYAHTAVDKDLKHCPPPQRLDGQPPSTAPVRLGTNRTLASRTDVVVCEPPRRLGAAPSDAAPRKPEPRTAPAAPAGPVPSPPAAMPSPPRPACEPAASAPPNAVVEAVADGFVVTLGPFPGVSRAADLDLTAHADELVVAGAALAAPLRVALERPVDPTRVKAKWRKLDRTLRVELTKAK